MGWASGRGGRGPGGGSGSANIIEKCYPCALRFTERVETRRGEAERPINHQSVMQSQRTIPRSLLPAFFLFIIATPQFSLVGDAAP